MWLSKREGAGAKSAGHARALTGPVTLPGKEIGAWLEGERRGVAVYAPGGYHWSPQIGDQVLVLKAGESGEQPCAVGVAQSEELSPGEVLIQGGTATVRLSNEGLSLCAGKSVISMTPKGEISLAGAFTVNGTVVGPLPPPEEDDESEEETANGASVS